MAEIDNAVEFSVEDKEKIERKMRDVNFTHTDWSSDDVSSVRKAARDHYRNEQGGLCAYCRNQVSLRAADNCHVEHIVPKSKRIDFIFHEKNLCVVCADCNTIKRSKETTNDEVDTLGNLDAKIYPRSSGAFLIFHPHFDNYSEHIEKFGSYYFDLTDKGHFTIGCCVLNRRLRSFGWDEGVIDDSVVEALMHRYLGTSNRLEKASAMTALMRYYAR